MKPYVGMLVTLRICKDRGGNTKITNDYPGIVYKLFEEEPEAVGLTLFQEGFPTRYGKVYHSIEKKENCWTELAIT